MQEKQQPHTRCSFNARDHCLLPNTGWISDTVHNTTVASSLQGIDARHEMQLAQKAYRGKVGQSMRGVCLPCFQPLYVLAHLSQLLELSSHLR